MTTEQKVTLAAFLEADPRLGTANIQICASRYPSHLEPAPSQRRGGPSGLSRKVPPSSRGYAVNRGLALAPWGATTTGAPPAPDAGRRRPPRLGTTPFPPRTRTSR